MSLGHSPSIVTNGLIFAYDMVNGKSFVGAPITNVLSTNPVNIYPSVGNSWGTYNTNQYNSATYFSIGTISSVSGNIVTTSAAHPLRSYDVVTPQSTGGGVTAGVNYLVKKLSSTTFSLHTYNSSQDGSQGYINPATGNHKVYDDYSNNVQISINATSFPTMWWGPPHLPNSGLVKEIISGGFNGLLGRPATDCIRLHFDRLDGVTDGMAYSVDASTTAGQVYTVSFWTRAVTPSAVGQYLSYQIYNYGTISPAGYYLTATIGPLGVWTKQTMTFTPVNPLCISYWFPSTGNMKVDIANIQFELGSVANNPAYYTRTSTQALLDLTNNNTITASSLTYASDNTFSFKANGQRLETSINTFGNNATWEAWINGTSNVSTYNMFMGRYLPYFGFHNANSLFFSNIIGGTQRTIQTSTNLSVNTWYHATFTTSYDGTNTTMKIYTNGVETATETFAGAQSWDNVGYNFVIGDGYNATWYRFDGQVPIARVYDRTLSASQVKQNFNALRGRYNI
jgi:hypothetical protein